MKTSLIKNSKKYPDFIKEHKIFSKFDKIDKIFPSIGLSNSCISVQDMDYKKVLVYDIRALYFNRITNVNYSSIYNKVIALFKTLKIEDFITETYIGLPKEKLQLPCGQNLENIFRHNHYYYLPKVYLNRLDDLNIYFSSNSKSGMWDLATMSERGIDSCQSWAGQFKRNLIGTMIDPFVGIIYLSRDSKSDPNRSMLARCLVRYVVNYKTHEPALLLERLYYNDSDNDKYIDNYAINLFTQYLKLKTKNKFSIINSATGYTIPNSKIVSALSECGRFSDGKSYCKSYRDSKIKYSVSHKTYLESVKNF